MNTFEYRGVKYPNHIARGDMAKYISPIAENVCSGEGIDVGAHTGIYTIDALRIANSVLSIEPYVLNFARLMMNVHHAGLDCSGLLYAAAGDVNETNHLLVKTANHYCSAGGRVGRESKNGQKFPINVRKIDTIIKPAFHHLVTVVKIDTEEYGKKVLAGMPEIIAKSHPHFILECIEEGMEDYLEGYEFFTINEKTGLSPVDRLIPDHEFSFDTPNRYARWKSS